MKKFIQVSCAVALLASCCLSVNANSQPVQETKIIDTVPIENNPVVLLQDEVRYTRNWDSECYDDTIQLSYDDAQRLLKIAYAEAGNQGVIGQLFVMQVVYNRTLSDKFPDTIAEVISQSGQFQAYIAGTYQTATPTWETHQALAILEKNRDLDYSIFAFEKGTNHSLDIYFNPVYQYEDHVFYTLKD